MVRFLRFACLLRHKQQQQQQQPRRTIAVWLDDNFDFHAFGASHLGVIVTFVSVSALLLRYLQSASASAKRRVAVLFSATLVATNVAWTVIRILTGQRASARESKRNVACRVGP